MTDSKDNTKLDLIDVLALAAVGAAGIGRDDICKKILNGQIDIANFLNEVEKSQSEAEG